MKQQCPSGSAVRIHPRGREPQIEDEVAYIACMRRAGHAGPHLRELTSGATVTWR